MAIKKKNFADKEIAIFDEAVIYKRAEYWQFGMWLNKENKYARKSLDTSPALTPSRHRSRFGSRALIHKSLSPFVKAV